MGKKAAEKTAGVLWKDGAAGHCLILPGGKPPMYAFHLQTPDFHLFIGRRENSDGKSPNAYVSVLARSLWLRGPRPAVDVVLAFVKSLGGHVGRAQVSRVDLCADFHLPGGLTLDFLREFRVSRSSAHSHYVNGDRLETFYVGSPAAPVLARIYDKAVEILAGQGEKLWFLEIWKRTECRDTWRVEFQVRRAALRQLGIDTFDDLIARAGGAWRYLTENWLSLRFHDADNTSRRTAHPWWLAVQEVGNDFGAQVDIKRRYATGGQAPAEWYVSHAGGCLAGFAARLGIDDFDSAVGVFAASIRDYWSGHSFDDRYRVERIKLGFEDSREADRQ